MNEDAISEFESVSCDTRRVRTMGIRELMAQKQVLGLKAVPRLEQIAEEYSERAQDGKHHIG